VASAPIGEVCRVSLNLKASTITRRCAGIRYMHRMAGYEPPTSSEAIKAVVAGIRRSLGTAVTRKAPATAETVRAIISDLPADLRGLRDRALLLLGFAGALRSELVALNVDDVEEPLRVCTSISGDQRRIRKVPVISSPSSWLSSTSCCSGQGVTPGGWNYGGPYLPLNQERRLSDSRKTHRPIRGGDRKEAGGSGRVRSPAVLGP
jgi:hypothetical protein